MPVTGKVYLIPSLLHEEATEAIPHYILAAIKDCHAFFVENERTARRYLKTMARETVIDDYEWYAIDKNVSDNMQLQHVFRRKMRQPKPVGIISEAGCPGVADPGQQLVAIAHEEGATVRPLVGPSALLLAVMASGMNGQHFQFVGYLPVDAVQRVQMIKQLEFESTQKKCTQVFIETPYRNNQLMAALTSTCKAGTRICVAANITAPHEWIRTHTVAEWKTKIPDLHKQPAVFCLLATR